MCTLYRIEKMVLLEFVDTKLQLISSSEKCTSLHQLENRQFSRQNANFLSHLIVRVEGREEGETKTEIGAPLVADNRGRYTWR
jgi:hypothetical protein